MSLSDSRRFVFPATAGAVALSTEIACANSAGAATGSQKGTRHFGRVRGAEKNRALSVNLDFVCPNSIAIFDTGVLALECCLSNLTSDAVYGLRAGFFALALAKFNPPERERMYIARSLQSSSDH